MPTPRLLLPLIFTGFFFTSCDTRNTTSNQPADAHRGEAANQEPLPAQSAPDATTPASPGTNDALAAKVRQYITATFLTAADARAIAEDQRKFQLHETDLNNDGRKEVFVNFPSTYFCGTGGCTMLLLSSELKLITRFSPIRTVYVGPATQNGWHVLLTETGGSWKKLVYENGTYPANPTVVETTAEAPDAQAEVVFDAEQHNAKTYSF